MQFYNTYRKNHIINTRELAKISEAEILMGVPTLVNGKYKETSIKDFIDPITNKKIRRHYNKIDVGSILINKLFQLMINDIIFNNTLIKFPLGAKLYIDNMSQDEINFKTANNLYSNWSSYFSNNNLFYIRYEGLTRTKRVLSRRVQIEYNRYHRDILERGNEGEEFVITKTKKYTDYLITIIKEYPYIEPVRIRYFLKNVMMNIPMLVLAGMDIHLSYPNIITIFTNVPSKGLQHNLSKEKEIKKKYILNNLKSEKLHKYRILKKDIDVINYYDNIVFGTYFLSKSSLDHYNKDFSNSIKSSTVLTSFAQEIVDNNLIDNFIYMKKLLK